MEVNEVIARLGGPQAVMKITQLSKGRISQWIKANEIPRPWMIVFHCIDPKIPHPDYKHSENRVSLIE